MAHKKDPKDASNSASGLVSTLVPNLAVASAMVLIFLILRRSQRRQYAPRTYVGSLRPQERTPDQADGFFSWLKSMAQLPDTYVLQHHSLDAYLLLRYLKVAMSICFCGCLITWPVLLPVNVTGGGGKKQLDLLTFGNVVDRNRYYAHACIAWIFITFVFFMITRECLYFVNLRQAYFMSSLYAARISSKTVLFTSVPEEYLDENKIRHLYGEEKVRNVWLVTDAADLADLVEERDKAAFKLEDAEVSLIKATTKARVKVGSAADASQDQNPSKVPAQGNSSDDGSGIVAGQYIKQSDRPAHRTKPIVGKKVDTIDWCRQEIERLGPEIENLQSKHHSGDAKLLNSVFVEFNNQKLAQSAFQILAHNQPLHMAPRYIGLTPGSVIWSNLRIKWWELIIRRFITTGIVAGLIIFWAIPVAFVGVISNVNYLTEKLPWLRFINDCPDVILGVITGLLPAGLMAVLMALVPIFLRLMAKFGGVPTTAAVELWTQNFYFGFQVVQVFLVTTISSAASSLVSSIFDDPSSAASLLAESIPKASNFYVSYFILQGLTFSAGALLQIACLVLSKVLGILLDNTPRKMYKRWSHLAGLRWGTVFPVLTNLCVIAITYAAIAPLVLGFAAVGLSLFYFAYRYNMLYVTDANIDTKGMVYPCALQQTLLGCYLLIICMIGLFAVGAGVNVKSLGPMILMIILLVVAVVYHWSLNEAITPLLDYLPKNLETEEEKLATKDTAAHIGVSASNNPKNPHRAVAGFKGAAEGSGKANPEAGLPRTATAAPRHVHGAVMKFFLPHIHADYTNLRKLVPHDFANISYEAEIERDAYYQPCIGAKAPLLWIPRDTAGVSTQEVKHTGRVIGITDEDAYIDDTGKITWNEEKGQPPIYQEKIYY